MNRAEAAQEHCGQSHITPAAGQDIAEATNAMLAAPESMRPQVHADLERVTSERGEPEPASMSAFVSAPVSRAD